MKRGCCYWEVRYNHSLWLRKMPVASQTIEVSLEFTFNWLYWVLNPFKSQGRFFFHRYFQIFLLSSPSFAPPLFSLSIYELPFRMSYFIFFFPARFYPCSKEKPSKLLNLFSIAAVYFSNRWKFFAFWPIGFSSFHLISLRSPNKKLYVGESRACLLRRPGSSVLSVS